VKKSARILDWTPIAWTDSSGNAVKGSYSIDKSDWMTVRLEGGGEKSARGGPAATSVAVIMLGELYREKSERLANG
jgi:hypothetical protein